MLSAALVLLKSFVALPGRMKWDFEVETHLSSAAHERG
jgi:hypothetical protein